MTSNIIDNDVLPFTEWIKKARLPHRENLIVEDNTKRHRLDMLHILLDLPYNIPEKMTPHDIYEKTQIFHDVSIRMGQKKCMFKLIPIDINLPKMRVKGIPFPEAVEWFLKLKLKEPNKYWIETVPRSGDISLSAIFIINNNNIWGEINTGRLNVLNEGTAKKTPIFFSFDFNQWKFSRENAWVMNLVKRSINFLKVKDKKMQDELRHTLEASFNKQKYLCGYFEMVVWPGNKIKFFDYNRLQSRTLNKFDIWTAIKNTSGQKPRSQNILTGISASVGNVVGRVRIVNNYDDKDFDDNDVLVCTMTAPEYLPLMLKSSAIITEQGTILSHAAIVSREIDKPCIIRVKNATKRLKNGQIVRVDANDGIIEILN